MIFNSICAGIWIIIILRSSIICIVIRFLLRIIISIKTFSILTTIKKLLSFHVVTGVTNIFCTKSLAVHLILFLTVFTGFSIFFGGAATNIVKEAVLFVFLDIDWGLKFLELLIQDFEVDFFFLSFFLGLIRSGNLTLWTKNHQIFDVGPFEHNLFVGLVGCLDFVSRSSAFRTVRSHILKGDILFLVLEKILLGWFWKGYPRSGSRFS